MIVNVNMCASAFDETFHVMKFSAIAKKVKKSYSLFFDTSFLKFKSHFTKKKVLKKRTNSLDGMPEKHIYC